MRTDEHRALTRLDGQRAFVTGGGSGIGRGIALLLGAAGAHVVVVDRDRDSAAAVAGEIGGDGGVADVHELDVTDPAAVRETFAALDGGLEILVNAAGIIVRKNLLETTHEEWRRVVDVNLTGYFNVLRAAVPALERSGAGRVVQIASISALIGYGYPSYTAAKGGVLSLTRELADELAPKGIRINSISPGVIETGINRDTLGQEQIRDATIAHTPLRRLGVPEDIARVALFLVTDLSSFVTGTDVVADGGMMSAIQWGAAADALRSAHRDAAPR